MREHFHDHVFAGWYRLEMESVKRRAAAIP
jgi:hypothetical protein